MYSTVCVHVCIVRLVYTGLRKRSETVHELHSSITFCFGLTSTQVNSHTYLSVPYIRTCLKSGLIIVLCCNGIFCLQVIAVTLINSGFHLHEKYDVPVVGKIPKG